MYISSKIKRFSAISLAVAITLGIFGMPQVDKSVTTHAVETDSYEQELSEFEKKQSDIQQKIDKADADISSQQEKLNAVMAQLEVTSQKIKTAEKHSAQIEKEICDIDDDMRKTTSLLSKQEEEIKKNVNDFTKRIRSMYLAGSTSYTDVIINASDFYDVLMRVELLTRVAEHDNKTIDSRIEQKQEIDTTKNDLGKQKDKLSQKSKKYADEQKLLVDEYARLLSLQNEYGTSLNALQNDKYELQNEVDKLVAEHNAKNTTTKSSEVTIAKTTKTSKESNKTTTTKETEQATTTKKSTTKNQTTATKTTTKKKTTAKTTTKKTTTKSPQQVAPAPTTSDYDTKINILMSTAKSMVGGAYVWGGSSPNATDCSGLTMQCYAKIGINLPHLASAQANYGTSVSYSNMKKGDLIFFGGNSYSSIYHVAIYIGNGMMIHAENSNTGIVISYVSSFSQYNHITCIKRLI